MSAIEFVAKEQLWDKARHTNLVSDVDMQRQAVSVCPKSGTPQAY